MLNLFFYLKCYIQLNNKTLQTINGDIVYIRLICSLQYCLNFQENYLINNFSLTV